MLDELNNNMEQRKYYEKAKVLSKISTLMNKLSQEFHGDDLLFSSANDQTQMAW
jgi:hypothetical protein